MKNFNFQWLCYCLTVSLFLLQGCSKEGISPPEYGLTLKQVRTMHEQIRQTPLHPSFLINSLSLSNSKLIPDWSKAMKTRIGDVLRYEIPLSGESSYMYLITSNRSIGKIKSVLVIELNEKAGLIRQFLVTLIGNQPKGELSYGSDKSTFRGIMAISSLSGEFLKGFLYDSKGRADIYIGESLSKEKSLATIKICEANVFTKSEQGDGNKPTHSDYCTTCYSIQPFNGNICLNCKCWGMDLPEIIVTPACPEHGRNCNICFTYCNRHNIYDCSCNPDNPYEHPYPPSSGEGGGSGQDNYGICSQCGDRNCPGGFDCIYFPHTGGGGPGGSGGPTEPQTIPFTFLDNESKAKISDFIMNINNNPAGGKLINMLSNWGVSIQYHNESNYFASYSSSNKTLKWGDEVDELIIFHELVHALHHQKGLTYVSNKMNREVEAFVGMFLYAESILRKDLLKGGKDDWENTIGGYITNPTEQNYMKMIEFVITTNPDIYSNFSENQNYRNINNINLLFNGN